MSRLRLMRAVLRKPGQRLRDLADETDLHINTTRDHLRVLEEEGFVVSEPETTGSRGRPPVVFYPTDSARTSAVATERLERAKAQGDLFRRMLPESERTDLLSDEAQHQIDTLYEHLEDSGLEPAVHEAELTVELVPCESYALTDVTSKLICSVHASLIKNQLSQVDGPLKMRELHPFVTATQCVLKLEQDPDWVPACGSQHKHGRAPETPQIS